MREEFPDYFAHLTVLDENNMTDLYIQEIWPWTSGKVTLLGDSACAEHPELAIGFNL